MRQSCSVESKTHWLENLLLMTSSQYVLFPVVQQSVEIGNKLPGLRLKSLFVGGLMKKNGSVVNGWRGCIQVRLSPVTCFITVNTLYRKLKFTCNASHWRVIPDH